MSSSYLFVLGTVAFTVFGQILIKWRVGHLGALPDSNMDRVWFLVKALFDPFIMVGLSAAVIASMFWIAAMTKLEISHAYPFVTAGLVVLTACAGIFLFGESVSATKIGGIALICVGVVMTSQLA